MTSDAEAAAIGRARKGSSEDFARLVGEHQQAVRGFLRRLLGNHADADDLAQEAFLAAWRKMAEFRGGEDFRAWIMGIAWRKWLTGRRGETRRRARETETWRDAPTQTTDRPDDRLDAAALLGELPDDQRAAVALCLAGGFSHGEAAGILGLPLGTVKSHVARGRARLLELMGGADDAI